MCLCLATVQLSQEELFGAYAGEMQDVIPLWWLIARQWELLVNLGQQSIIRAQMNNVSVDGLSSGADEREN